MFVLVFMLVVMFMMVFVIMFVVMFMMMFVFMFMIMVVVMMLVFFILFFVVIFQTFRESVGGSGHSLKDHCSGEFIPWCGDDPGFRIQFTDDRNIFCQFFFTDILCSGKNDTCGSLDLIVKEFLEIPVVYLASSGIHNRTVTIQF